jgi:hypothetical protein
MIPVSAPSSQSMDAAHEKDHSGRPRPVWQSCRVIGYSEIFLMNPDEPGSLDGRDFGPVACGTLARRTVGGLRHDRKKGAPAAAFIIVRHAEWSRWSRRQRRVA